jgi:hypothetical protein
MLLKDDAQHGPSVSRLTPIMTKSFVQNILESQERERERERDGSRTCRKKRCILSREKQICPPSATKPGRHKIPTFCSAAPGRRLLATVATLPACPRTAALRLALCPSLSRVSSFTFVLARAHLPAFHSHFLNCSQYGHCVSQNNSLNHVFFCLSHCT